MLMLRCMLLCLSLFALHHCCLAVFSPAWTDNGSVDRGTCFRSLNHMKTTTTTKNRYISGPGSGFSSCTPELVLAYVKSNGWNSSQVHASSKQAHLTNCKMYQGDCSSRGENLLGTCFCLPGFSGEHCQNTLSHFTDSAVPDNIGTPNGLFLRKHARHEAWNTLDNPPAVGGSSCTHSDDRCFFTLDGGVWTVSHDRWRMAQIAESSAWKEATGQQAAHPTGDRVDEHMVDFASYEPVGPRGTNLGTFLEIGSGPWTQSKYMIEAREFKVDKYVLLEPNALNYARDTASTVYATGQVEGKAFRGGKTVVVNAGGEHLDLMQGVFDTVMLINVLEHTKNAIQILRNTFNALKPGGLLIFNDRWWDNYKPSSDLTVDTLYHPIRMKKRVFDVFLNGFDKVYELHDRQSYAFSKDHRNFNGTYYIGRKKIC